MERLTFTRRISDSLVTAADAVLTCIGIAQSPASSSFLSLSEEQIVDRMQMHDQAQTEELGSYQALRHYALEYRGFFKTLSARMDVEVNYDASSGKSFQIVSESGSHMLCEKVLQRTLDREKEASLNRSATALTRANYTFHLIDSEIENGRLAYILDVKPIVPRKFLYRGRIWVDGVDFAVARMEVQPGKSPSFWLPQHNRSETEVRIGGTAVMTIDYGTYRIVFRQSRPVVSEPY